MPSTLEAEGGTAETETPADPRRWAVLGVLCLCLVVVGIDGTIVNVALPTLVRELDASSSELQWIVDAYTIVFAGLLLLAGNTGDRLGRRGALFGGLVVFGAGSLVSAFVGSPEALIATRAVQGLGAAFIMPTTLSILTNVFRDPRERTRAISLWAGVSGLGVAIGPVTGGFLLEHFWWGSIFLVNVPVVIVTLALVALLVPRSKDPDAPRLDLLGTVLVTFGLVSVLYGIIEGPVRGWTDGLVLAGFVVGAVLLVAFILWELHIDYPILDMSFFANPRFSAASLAITLVFFALFGTLYFLSQYMQFVLGYSPLESGLALLPLAAVLIVVSAATAPLARWLGTKVMVAAGLGLAAAGLAVFSTVSLSSGYGLVLTVLLVVGGGIALAMSPATDSIMGSLPPERAGVGSAVNDTTREIGGALGVAILGSVLNSGYRSALTANPQFATLQKASAEAAAAVKDSVGGASQVAAQLPADAARAVTSAANAAFVDSLDTTVLVGAAVAIVGALIALLFLPARAPEEAPAPAVARRPGQPDLDRLVAASSARLAPRRRLVDATLDVLAGGGWSSLTFHAIASRADVAASAVEARYRSEADAVVDAVSAVFEEVPVLDSGSFRQDARAYLAGFRETLTRPRARAVVATLLDAAAQDPDLAVELRSKLLDPRRHAVVAMVERAQARGEVPAERDADLVADLLSGPVMLRVLTTGESLTPESLDEIVDIVAGPRPVLNSTG